MEKQKPPEGPPQRSRYFDKLLCMQFIDMVQKYDKFVQPKKRVEALRMTRKHLAKQFMKLYRMHRLKKHGEPLQEEQVKAAAGDELSDHDDFFTVDHMPSPLKEVNMAINSKLSEIEKYLTKDDEKSLTK